MKTKLAVLDKKLLDIEFVLFARGEYVDEEEFSADLHLVCLLDERKEKPLEYLLFHDGEVLEKLVLLVDRGGMAVSICGKGGGLASRAECVPGLGIAMSEGGWGMLGC